MLPRVAAADLTSQDVLVLTQPGNNPGQKNKGLELGAMFDANSVNAVQNRVLNERIISIESRISELENG
jgi:hypothetical protein